MRVAAPDVHGAVHDCGRRLEPDLIVDGVVLAALERPPLLARFRVDRVEVAVPAADVDSAIDYRRRGVDHVAGGELPLQDAGLRVGRVDISVAAPDVDLAVRDGGRGGEEVPRVGNGLCRGGIAVQVLRLEFALELGGEDPLRLAGGDVERRERARRGNEIDHPASDRRRRRDGHARLELPLLLAGVLDDRMEVPVHRPEVHHAVGDGRRGHDRPAGLERPLHSSELLRSGPLVDPGVRVVPAEGVLRRGGSRSEQREDRDPPHGSSPMRACASGVRRS